MIKNTVELNKKGFTLIETIVSIAVFLLAIVMITGFFSSFLKNYSIAKKNQRSIENAQYVMNLMAKTLRTSSLEADYASFPIRIFDYSRLDHNCIIYNFRDNRIVAANTTDASPSDISECNWGSINAGSYRDLTEANIAHAYVDATATTSGATPVLGKATISLQVSNAPQDFPIQMTVSLRQ